MKTRPGRLPPVARTAVPSTTNSRVRPARVTVHRIAKTPSAPRAQASARSRSSAVAYPRRRHAAGSSTPACSTTQPITSPIGRSPTASAPTAPGTVSNDVRSPDAV